ncbi:MAG: glycoside hydrolase family 43, partial [Nocardioidaceae bacterium]|nr:glycoside hydrolase family 43 [Nocardioidaceae bacterium]
NQWVAYGTNTGNVNLPVMISPDLLHWTARGLDPGATSNDALPQTPAWSDFYSATFDGRRLTESWAPSVARVKSQYVLAYAVEVPGRGKCISLARSASPIGPFVDTSAGPVVCPAQNVIDPQIFTNGKKRYLLWKTEGNAATVPKLWIQKMTKSASALAPKGKKKRLLTAKPGWEAGLIENPAMIRFKGRFYLFYSANKWATSAYATGYAICKTVTGPCKRKGGPLLGVAGPLAGIGGATPFVARGHLRLLVHAWTTGQGYTYAKPGAACVSSNTCPQRRIHTVLLKKKKKGGLLVSAFDVP